jgi:hypothetical protein
VLKTAARFLLLRVLPRRLIPVVTVVEIALLLRNVRRKARTKVNPPRESRTASPRPVSETAAASPAPDTTP